MFVETKSLQEARCEMPTARLTGELHSHAGTLLALTGYKLTSDRYALFLPRMQKKALIPEMIPLIHGRI